MVLNWAYMSSVLSFVALSIDLKGAYFSHNYAHASHGTIYTNTPLCDVYLHYKLLNLLHRELNVRQRHATDWVKPEIYVCE